MAEILNALRLNRDAALDTQALNVLSQLTDRQLEQLHRISGAFPPSVRAEITAFRLRAGPGFILGRLMDIDPNVMNPREFRTYCFGQVLAARFATRFVNVYLGAWSSIAGRAYKVEQLRQSASFRSAEQQRIAHDTENSGVWGLATGLLGKGWDLIKRGIYGAVRTNPVVATATAHYNEIFGAKDADKAVAQQFAYAIAVEFGIDPTEAHGLIARAIQGMGSPENWAPWMQRWFFNTRNDGQLFWYHLAEAAQSLPASLLYVTSAPNASYPNFYGVGTVAGYPSLSAIFETGGDDDDEYGEAIGGPIFADDVMSYAVGQLPAGGDEIGGLPLSEVGNEFGGFLQKSRGLFGSAMQLLNNPLIGAAVSAIPGGGLITGAARLAGPLLAATSGPGMTPTMGKPLRPGPSAAEFADLIKQVRHVLPAGGDDDDDDDWDDEGGDLIE